MQMKTWHFALAALVASGFGIAYAQTTAVGPYYSMPAWDQKLPASQRFVVLSNWNSEAVLDRETGLVWQRQPDAAKFPLADAIVGCRQASTGDRLGWRLPMFDELNTLLDPTQTNPPALPAGHPFVGITAEEFWTATKFLGLQTTNYTVLLQYVRGVTGSFGAHDRVTLLRYWCVRGGSSNAPDGT
jgi:hypothetical protein